jgi:hypothetical protein
MTQPDHAEPADLDPAAGGAEDTETEDQRLDREWRQNKANRACRGTLAAVLTLEALVMLLVPRAIAQTSTGLTTTKTLILVAFAVGLILVGAMLRRPWGIAVGSLMQLIVVATGLWEPTLFIVAACFIGIWLYVLNLRSQLVGTPGGVQMLYSP